MWNLGNARKSSSPHFPSPTLPIISPFLPLPSCLRNPIWCILALKYDCLVAKISMNFPRINLCKDCISLQAYLVKHCCHSPLSLVLISLGGKAFLQKNILGNGVPLDYNVECSFLWAYYIDSEYTRILNSNCRERTTDAFVVVVIMKCSWQCPGYLQEYSSPITAQSFSTAFITFHITNLLLKNFFAVLQHCTINIYGIKLLQSCHLSHVNYIQGWKKI